MELVLETFPSVQVADMSRATAFYVQAVGATVVFASAEWTSLRIAGVRVGLALAPEHGGARTGLHFTVRDRAAVRARVLAAGGALVAEALPVARGIVIDDVADTEGNVFALVEARG